MRKRLLETGWFNLGRSAREHVGFSSPEQHSTAPSCRQSATWDPNGRARRVGILGVGVGNGEILFVHDRPRFNVSVIRAFHTTRQVLLLTQRGGESNVAQRGDVALRATCR